MPAQVVDSFNVDGNEYHIEPVLDAVPTEGSQHAVQSGGVYESLQQLDIDVSGKADKTTTVNGQPLSSDVTITKAELGLGNVANTGDSGTPAQNGTSKFTTGGAFNFFRTTSYEQWVVWALSHRLGQKWLAGSGIPAAASNIYTFTANGMFFAVAGTSGALYASSNGISWQATNITSGIAYAFSVVYFKNVYVLLGNGKIYWSSNGTSWTQSSLSFTPGQLGFASNGSVLIHAGSSGLVYSTDGKTWAACTGSGLPAAAGFVAYANGVFVYVPIKEPSALSTFRVFRSTNGTAFSAVTFGSAPTSPSCGGGLGYMASNDTWYVYVADKDKAYVGYSTNNGATWTSTAALSDVVLPSGSGGSIYMVVMGNNLYFWGPDSHVKLARPNSPQSMVDLGNSVSGLFSALCTAEYVGGVYVVGSVFGQLWISCDGTNFAATTMGTTVPQYMRMSGRVAVLPGRIVAADRYSTLFDSRCL